MTNRHAPPMLLAEMKPTYNLLIEPNILHENATYVIISANRNAPAMLQTSGRVTSVRSADNMTIPHDPRLDQTPYSGAYILGYEEIPDLYKIGFTSDIRERVRTLKIAMPFDPVIYHFFPCDFSEASKIEELLHTRLTDKHVRREWYRLTSQEFEQIKAETQIPDSLQAISAKAVAEALDRILGKVEKPIKPRTMTQSEYNILGYLLSGDKLKKGRDSRDTYRLGARTYYRGQIMPLLEKGYIREVGVFPSPPTVRFRNGKRIEVQVNYPHTLFEITEIGIAAYESEGRP